jgi:hypothetical protein
MVECAGGGTRTGTGLSSYGFSFRFGFRRHLAFVIWTIPSPWLRGLVAANLVSTPSRLERAWLEIASKGFPDFEQF